MKKRLSVASTDVELFKNSNLPPAFFAYGTEDPFYNQMNACVEALKEAGTDAEIEIFDGLPHGFGLGEGTVAEGWINNAIEFWRKNMKS